MATKKTKSKKEDISFEQAIRELTEIVGKIEVGEMPLQESLDKYERGMTLIRHCRDILTRAEKRIEKIADTDVQSDG